MPLHFLYTNQWYVLSLFFITILLLSISCIFIPPKVVFGNLSLLIDFPVNSAICIGLVLHPFSIFLFLSAFSFASNFYPALFVSEISQDLLLRETSMLSSYHRSHVFYNCPSGVIFVYDLSQRKTKANLNKWAVEVAETGTFSAPLGSGGPGGLPVPYLVIANKVDIVPRDGTRASSGNLVDLARQWAEKQGLLRCSEELPLTESFPGNSGLVSVRSLLTLSFLMSFCLHAILFPLLWNMTIFVY